MERGFNAKQTRHCEEDRRKNTRRRRQNKKQERKRKREELTKETNDEGNISTEAPCLANEQMVASGETSSFEMEELQRLKEENNRLHKHAVYFHCQWKKSEEKAESSGNLKELDKNHLVIDEEIGEGTFGLCYRATYGTIKVAVKEIKSASLDRQIVKEAEILQSLRHPNLPLLLGVCFNKSPYLIVTTYHGFESDVITESTTMHNALCHHDIVSSNLRSHWLLILRDLSAAISYVHQQGIIHNDIKTNNVVVEKHDDNYSAVLIDFGKATATDNGRLTLHSMMRRKKNMKKNTHTWLQS